MMALYILYMYVYAYTYTYTVCSYACLFRCNLVHQIWQDLGQHPSTTISSDVDPIECSKIIEPWSASSSIQETIYLLTVHGMY